MQDIKNVNDYLKKISKSYSSKKKITDILNNFRLLTPEYQKFNETDDSIQYSSPVFSECTPDEQEVFVNTELVTFESGVCNSIYEKYGFMYSWKDIYDLVHDPLYKNTEKVNRKVVYSSMVPTRPIGDKAFETWNGLQIIDLDIKNTEITEALKPIIFDELKKYHWFVGLTKSASGKSLHIWTKITPISINPENKRVEYFCNFRHKYSDV